MSKVVIQGNASGTGDFTIAAPNSNTNMTLTLPDEAGTVLTTSGVSSNAMPAGSVVQVVTTIATDPQVYTSSSYTALNDLSLNITPTSASSKILLIANINASASFRYYSFRIYRDSTPVALSTATGIGSSELVSFQLGMNNSEAGYNFVVQSGGGSVLDAPSTTSQITYSIQARKHYATGSGSLCINRPATTDNNYSYTMYTTSNFIAMDVAQ